MLRLRKLFARQKASDHVPGFTPPLEKWFHSPEELNAKYAGTQNKAEELEQPVYLIRASSNQVKESKDPVLPLSATSNGIESLVRSLSLVEAPNSEVLKRDRPLPPPGFLNHETEWTIRQPLSREVHDGMPKERSQPRFHREASSNEIRNLIPPCLRPGLPQCEARTVCNGDLDPIPPNPHSRLSRNGAFAIENNAVEPEPPPLPPRNYLILPPEVLKTLRSRYKFAETPSIELDWESCMRQAAGRPCEIQVPIGEKKFSKFVVILTLGQ